jgi:hypothetical protein
VVKLSEFYQSKCHTTLTNLSARLALELQSGGNIRLEIGAPDDRWFISCVDLVLSRFCASDYKELGIEGVKVQRVTRIYNRMLRVKFDERVNELQTEGGDETR